MKKLSLILTLCLFSAVLWGKTTVIYHTSDTHGFFYPKNNKGGFAVLGALLAQEKKPYLLLDSGDFAEGTIETKTSKGLKAVELMNKVGYHAATLGNHEFAYGDSALEKILSKTEFSVLAANFFEKDSFLYPKHVRPYQVFNIDGVKIAVIGLANRNPTKNSQKFVFGKPLDALNKVLAEKEVKQAQAVVVLAHDSLADDRPEKPFYMGEIGRKLSDKVHVVLGGHAHKVFQNEYVGKVLFVESGYNLKNVSKIVIETDDKTGKFVRASSEFISLNEDRIGKNATIEKWAETIKEPGVDEVLGELKNDLSLKPLFKNHKDTSADNWVADLAREYSQTDIFVSNVGGVRVPLYAGPVTRRDIIDMFPFDDQVVKMQVNGQFLKSLLKDTLLPRNLLSFSGLKVEYKNKNGKIKNLKIWVNGKPVKNHQWYTLGTNSYLARKRFNRVADQQTVGEKTIRTLIEDALRKVPVLAPDSGRIIEK